MLPTTPVSEPPASIVWPSIGDPPVRLHNSTCKNCGDERRMHPVRLHNSHASEHSGSAQVPDRLHKVAGVGCGEPNKRAATPACDGSHSNRVYPPPVLGACTVSVECRTSSRLASGRGGACDRVRAGVMMYTTGDFTTPTYRHGVSDMWFKNERVVAINSPPVPCYLILPL